MDGEQQVAEDEIPEELPRCPFCPERRPFGRPAEAWHHYRARHPEWRLVGPGPWPLLERKAPPRILGAVYADEDEIPLDPAAVRRAVEKARLGHELTDEERELIRQAMQSLVPVFEQMRQAFADMFAAMLPAMQRIARAFANIRQDDYALAPPRPGEPRRRGPGRRGRAAQRSPYGPQGRR